MQHCSMCSEAKFNICDPVIERKPWILKIVNE